MKLRIVAFLTIVMCFTARGFSGNELFTLGIKGGIGLSSVWGGGAADTAPMTSTFRAGVCVGGMFELHFNEYLAAALECFYAMKGTSAAGDFTSYTKGIANRTEYLDVPLLLRYRFKVSESAHLFLNAGPTVSFLISSKEDSAIVYQPSQLTKVDTTLDLKSQTDWYDIGITLGAGMSVAGGPGEIIFDVRYTLGLMNLYRQTSGPIRGNARPRDVKNSYIAFMIGYSIPIF